MISHLGKIFDVVGYQTFASKFTDERMDLKYIFIVCFTLYLKDKSEAMYHLLTKNENRN